MINKSNIVYAIMIVIVILICIFLATLEYQNEETHICKIEDKWIKRESKSSDVYLVQCDNQVYKISDLLFKGKFDSSDIYARLKVGKKYKIKTTGYRVGLFSMYKNINEFEKVGNK